MEKQLQLGMAVHCLDGDAGRLERIVTEPGNHKPAYLVVRRGRLARRRDLVVPVSLVKNVSEERILLDTMQKALDTFPEYEETVKRVERQPARVPAPLPPLLWPAWAEEAVVIFHERTVPEFSKEIKRGMPVYDNAGAKVGQVEGIIVDAETHMATHLVLGRKGVGRDEPRILPVDLVDFVIRAEVYLRITKDQVQGLTLYQPEQAATA